MKVYDITINNGVGTHPDKIFIRLSGKHPKETLIRALDNKDIRIYNNAKITIKEEQ